jgi:putative DNA methylase
VGEARHQLIRAYNTDGDSGAAAAGKAEAARRAYQLYPLCERTNRAEDTRAYTEVLTGWSAIFGERTRRPEGGR